MVAILFSGLKSCFLRSLSFQFLNILLELDRTTESNSKALCLLCGMCSAQVISCCTCFTLGAKLFAFNYVPCSQLCPVFREALMATGLSSSSTLWLVFGWFVRYKPYWRGFLGEQHPFTLPRPLSALVLHSSLCGGPARMLETAGTD